MFWVKGRVLDKGHNGPNNGTKVVLTRDIYSVKMVKCALITENP